MSELDGQTVNFGEQSTAAEEDSEATGYAEHSPGYMEAPPQVADATTEEVEGAARPQILQLSED